MLAVPGKPQGAVSMSWDGASRMVWVPWIAWEVMTDVQRFVVVGSHRYFASELWDCWQHHVTMSLEHHRASDGERHVLVMAQVERADLERPRFAVF